LTLVRQHRVCELPGYQSVPEELLELKEVALSGDGEPTLCPNFRELVQEVVHLRAQALLPGFKIVLLTNATGLHLPEVQSGLQLLTSQDEIWAKLDAGTQPYMDFVNHPEGISLEKIMRNILLIARQRPVVIQSLFPLMPGHEPPPEEIEEYVHRLEELQKGGAKISLVQVYSAHRAPHRLNCGHVQLKCLSRIAQRVRAVTGLPAEVF